MTHPAADGRPRTAQEFVLEELRRGIAAGDFGSGTPLRQDALADRLGVSRVPIREALKMLAGEGLVIYRPHRGYYVAELSLADLAEVYRIRQLLETEAALRAVSLIDDSGVKQIRATLHRVEEASAAGNVVAMAKANRSFHFEIFEASQMKRLVRLVRVLWDATDAYRAVYYAEERNRRRVHREHRAMVTALRARDADRLVSLLDDHRRHAVEALEAIIVAESAER